MERVGGYPRIWFPDGGSWNSERLVPDDQVAEYERGWRAVGCRVEWLRSPHGRLDNALPQTLERTVHNQNVRSWLEHRKRPY